MHLQRGLRWCLHGTAALIVIISSGVAAQDEASLTIKPDRNDPKISAVLDTKNLAEADVSPLGDIPPNMFLLGIAPSPTNEKDIMLSESNRQWMTEAAKETVFDEDFKTSFTTYYPELGVHLTCSWRGPAHVMKKVMAEVKGTAVQTQVPDKEEKLAPSDDPDNEFPLVLRFSVANIPCFMECEPEEDRCSLKNMKQIFDSGRIVVMQPGVE